MGVEIIDARKNAAAAEVARAWVFAEWSWRVETEAENRRWFTEAFLSHEAPHPVCFVAQREGRAVGTAALERDDLLAAPFDLASGATPWLAGLYVAPEARGRGVAKALIDAVMERARAIGAPMLWLQTDGAEALYARFGFTTIGEAQSSETGGTVMVMRVKLVD